MRTILQERGLWRDGLTLRCKGKCRHCWPLAACIALARQPDFASQPSRLEVAVPLSGHVFEIYPKFHCECNFISRSKPQSLRRHIIPVPPLPPSLLPGSSWDGTEGNPERNFWKFDLESRFLAMDGISVRFKIATVRANVHGAVRNWFLAHPEWTTGNAGTSVDLLHQLEKEFTTN
ncbi:hypothetical protein V1504DRAFT_54197 [Lipomyces starkeyi]